MREVAFVDREELEKRIARATKFVLAARTRIKALQVASEQLTQSRVVIDTRIVLLQSTLKFMQHEAPVVAMDEYVQTEKRLAEAQDALTALQVDNALFASETKELNQQIPVAMAEREACIVALSAYGHVYEFKMPAEGPRTSDRKP